jgi:hypothetical protein
MAIWSPVAPWSIIDPNISWKSWSIPPVVQDYDLLCSLQCLELVFSIYDEASLRCVDGLGGVLEFGNIAGRSLKRVKVTMTYNDLARKDEEGLDAGTVGKFVQLVKDVLHDQRRLDIIQGTF